MVKNLFGGAAIFMDRPFKVGQRVNYKGYDGFIEEIGFRITRLRTLTGHLITIPNGGLTSDAVENIGQRPFIRRTDDITIPYDTPREKVAEALQIVRNLFQEDGLREEMHPVINGDEYAPRVYFSGFNAASLNLFLIYWHRVPEKGPDWYAFMAHSERFNLRLFEAFGEAGIDFAFPTQTLYLAGDQKRRLAVQWDNQEQSVEQPAG